MAPFARQLIKEILQRAHQYPSDNWDYLRFGPNPAAQVRGQIVLDMDWATDSLLDVLNHISALAWLHDSLEDPTSRSLLVDLLAYRVLGSGHVKLPLNTPQFWEEYRALDARFRMEANVAWSGSVPLHRYRLPIDNQEVTLVGHPLSILLLRLNQYYFRRHGARIQPEPGDVVIDGGACWGEAAISFALAVGEQGRVFSFEFVPENLAIFRANLSADARLAGTVTVVDKALGRGTTPQSYQARGPATSLSTQYTGRMTETVPLDQYVAEVPLPRVDFIKMDIEGSELDALQGARETIRRFRPKLAISLYHRPHDLFEIPQLIRQIEPSYRLHLDHYTIHQEETVLYAQAR
jgi:FkbM family methyltransferase